MVTAEHILRKQCCIVTLPPWMPSFFSSLRKIPQRHDIEGTVTSLLQTGNCTKGWKWPQEPKTNPHTSPALSLQSSSPPSTFLRLQGELCEAPESRSESRSALTDGVRRTEDDMLWVCCSLCASPAESRPSSAPRSSQPARPGGEEQEPVTF